MISKRLPLLVYEEGIFRECSQDVAVEAPLKCMVNGRLLCRCMRLPGMDVELCLGLCYTMGLIQRSHDIVSIVQPCEDIVVVETKEEIKDFPDTLPVVYSSGGFLRENDYCSIKSRSTPLSEESDFFSDDNLFFLQEDFLSRQKCFNKPEQPMGQHCMIGNVISWHLRRMSAVIMPLINVLADCSWGKPLKTPTFV